MKKLSCLITLLLLGTQVQAASLASLQSQAVENRELIRRYEIGVAQSEQDRILARSGYYPTLDLLYSANALDEESLYEAQRNSTVSGRLGWNVFRGFSDRYNLESAELKQEVAELQLASIHQEIKLAVALAYLEVYERLANVRVAESAFETLQRVYRDGENRYQVGLIGKNELLKFRVDYDNADINLKAAKAGLAKSINGLARQAATNIELEELGFTEFDALPERLVEEEYRQKMLENRREILALEAAIAASQSQAKAEQGGYYPRVDLQGSYSRYDDALLHGSGDEDEDELRGQLLMSLNLFQGKATESRVARAKLETRGLNHDLEELIEEYLTELDNLFIDFKVSLDNVEVSRRSIEQAEENLRITQLKYDEGLQRESDLLDAITNLSRAKYNAVAVVRTVYANSFQLTRMVDGF